LRRTVNNNSYATYNFQPDQALFYLKPVLKRKQKTGFLGVFSRRSQWKLAWAVIGWITLDSIRG
jgi:hypothetical protein